MIQKDSKSQHPSKQISQDSSYKLLNEKLLPLLRKQKNKFTKTEQDELKKIILHGQQFNNIQQLLNMRYTNKLSYLLSKLELSEDIVIQVQDQIARVQNLMMNNLCNYSHILKMEGNAHEKLSGLSRYH